MYFQSWFSGILLTLIFTLSGCGSAPSPVGPSQPKDIGTAFGNQYIYFLQGDHLILGACPSGTIVINRSNCPEVQRVMSWSFYYLAEKKYLDQINRYESDQNQNYELIDQLDLKIELLLSASPQYDQSLLPDIRRKESSLSTLESQISGTREQISLILSQLAVAEDPDLRELLHAHQGTLQTALNARSELIAELNALRKRHLDANGNIVSTDTFKRLIRQRHDAIARLSIIEVKLNSAISVFGGYLSSLKFMKEGIVWTFDNHWEDPTSIAVSDYDEIFKQLATRSKYATWGGEVMWYLTGLSSAKIENIVYSNQNSGNNCLGVIIYNKDFSLQFIGNGFSASLSTIQHYPELRPLFEKNISGHLRLKPVCNGPTIESDYFSKMILH